MWFWNWLATRAASFWIMAIASAVISAGIYQFQGLRIKAAKCDGRQDVQAQIERLTERVVRDVEDEADERIKEIIRAADACGDSRVPDAVLDSLRDD